MAYHADSSHLDDKEILTWEGFGLAQRELAQMIADSGFNPTLVIAVARGGMIPAGALSYSLGVKPSDAINVEFYTDIAETLPEPVLLPPLMDVSALDGKRVLVVDDVADSGKTLKMVMDLIRERGLSLDGETTVRMDAKCAVIYEKSRSIIKPDFVWKHTDLWINFPWSTLPVVSAEDDH